MTNVPVAFPALVGSQFVITFTGVRDEYAANYYSAGPLALPLGVAEIGMPGVQSPATPAQLPGTCVSNLMSIDGHPIDVALVGSTQNALERGSGPARPLRARRARHHPRAGHPRRADRHGAHPELRRHAIDLHRVEPRPARPGFRRWRRSRCCPHPTSVGTPQLPATQPGPAPAVTMTASHIDSKTATVTGAKAPFELVLGESVNKGWHATAEPGPHAPAGAHAVDLGTLGAGRRLRQRLAGLGPGLGRARVARASRSTVTWTPQNLVWGALAVSGATIVLCLVLGFLPTRSRRWLRARLPRRLRGPAGPDAPERPSAPFDPPMLTVPFVPAGGLPPDRSASDDADRRGAVRRSDAGHTVADASVAETSLTNAPCRSRPVSVYVFFVFNLDHGERRCDHW